jgi:hypothetical protein
MSEFHERAAMKAFCDVRGRLVCDQMQSEGDGVESERM